jgi:hypothetical protein
MSKVASEVRLLARRHTRKAIAVLFGIARSRTASAAARIAAANSLIDRGWGKTMVPVTGNDDKQAPAEITEIVTTIVDPKPQDDTATEVWNADE